MIKLFSETPETHALPVLFGLSFIIFGWFSFSLALGGFFLFPLILSGAILSGTMTLLLAFRLLSRSPLDLRIAFAVALLFASLVGYFSEPTLFSGRDQGSISEAAFRLAQNGQLAFDTGASQSFFNIYGEGTALNFPGFAYTKEGSLITQFPLGYTAWLGSFISLFGEQGPQVANTLLLFLFLFALYNLLRIFVHPFYASAGLALAIFSFLPTWFAKITLSENLAVFLFVFLAWNLVLFLQEGKFLSYASILFSASLFAFTRIEGFAFLALALIILAFTPLARKLWISSPWKSVAIPGIAFLFLFLRDFFINLPYYKMIGKALIKFLHQLGGGSIRGDLASAGETFTLGSVFFLYGLLALFVLGLFGLLIFIKEKKYILLLPALLALPTFVYLFDPNISLDHPWMLRRYLFSLFPTLLFSAVIGLALLFAKDKSLPIQVPEGKRLFFVSIIFLGLLLLQYPAWSSGIAFAENRTLLAQTQTFAKEFSDKDLVLVDRNATGDGFAMITGPASFLYEKNTIYFFNPYDLETLDVTPFENIYLLVPEGDQGRYVAVFGDRLVFQKTVTFSQERFENLSLKDSSLLRMPEKTYRETRNLLFQIQ